MCARVQKRSDVSATAALPLQFHSKRECHMSPMHQVSPVPLPSSSAQSPDRRTLLYVEDNPANLALVQQLIARRGNWKLLTAIDGDLGILVARNNQPEVIVMDINLPGINGFETLKILQADPLTAHIPVIALSSNAFQNDVEKGHKAGFFRYLTKPYKIDEFMDTLDSALIYSRESHTSL
jgi:CheY-like chemotaxis protein